MERIRRTEAEVSGHGRAGTELHVYYIEMVLTQMESSVM